MRSDLPLIDGDLVAVDIEATGCRPGVDAMIEIGAVRIRAGRIVATFGELVASPIPIPYSIQLLTGITERMLRRAAPVPEALERFRRFAEGSVLVAHNYRFDLGFLDYEAELAWGRPFHRPVLDTLAIARTLYPELARHNLFSLAEEFGVETAPTHRACDDARAAAEVFLHMLPELLRRGLGTAEDVAALCGLPDQWAAASRLPVTTSLPAAPGLYIMRDKDGDVLYMGRAKSIRHRVRSYFYSPSSTAPVMAALHTERVDHVVCRSELDALLVESRLVSRYHPRMQVGKQRGDVSVLIHVDDTEFPALGVTTSMPAGGVVLGPFTSIWALETLADKIREVYGLRRCTGVLTRDSWKTECSRRDLDQCSKPCIGGVAAEDYAGRMCHALDALRGDGEQLRIELATRQRRAAAAHRYEEAIGYRDAVRALDRVRASRRVLQAVSAEDGVVLLSGDDEQLTMHFVRGGCCLRSIRLPLSEVGSVSFIQAIRRAVDRLLSAEDREVDPLTFTPQQLRDAFIIHSYRRQSQPVEVPLVNDADTMSAVVFASADAFVSARRHKKSASPSVA